MGYTYGYKGTPVQSGTSYKAPIRPGNFYSPAFLNSVSGWTERTPPERVNFDVMGMLPQAMQIPGSALEAPVKFVWEALATTVPGFRQLEDENGVGPLQNIVKWLEDVTPLGAVSRGADSVLTELSKAQSSIYNAGDAAMVPTLAGLPDNTIITREMLDASETPRFGFTGTPRYGWIGRTVREFKQDLADRGFNLRFDDQGVPTLMSWDEVSSIVRSDALMGKYQFGESTVSTSLPTHMLYQIATDPLNLLFGAGAATKTLSAGRLLSASERVVAAQEALAAAQAANKGVAAAKQVLAAAEAAQRSRLLRLRLPTVAWSESPLLKRASIAGNSLRQAWGVGYLEDVVKAGLRVNRAPSAAASASSMAATGTSQAGTIAGLGHMLNRPTQFLLGTKGTSPFMRYYRTGLRLQVGSVLTEHISGGIADALRGDAEDDNLVSGFFAGIHDAAYDINNKHILSEDSLYTLATVWLLPTFEAAKGIIPRSKPLAGGVRLKDWMELEPTYNPMGGIRAAKKAEQTFLNRFEGGVDGFAIARRLIIGRMAFKRFIQQNPKLKMRLESFEYLIRTRFMAEKLEPMIQSIIDEGKITEAQLMEEFREWATTHGRTIFDEGEFKTDVPREVAFSLTPEQMIEQWNKYLQAMRRLHEIVDPRLEATIVRADRMPREAIDDMIAALSMIEKGGMVDVRVLQSWLSDTQAMFEDPGMNPGFWERYMNAGVAQGPAGDMMVPVKPILDELAKVRDNAPTERELFHEPVMDEASAPDSPITITDFGDNSPLTPEGIRLVQDQRDIDVVSIEQNVPFAAAQRVRLRLENTLHTTFTTKGLPKVEAQWVYNRTVRRHSDRIFARLRKGLDRPRLMDPKTGEAIGHGKTGYQVGRHPGEFAQILPGDTEGLAAALQMVRRYYPDAEISVVMDDAGRLVLEPSTYTKTLEDALEMARQSGQQYVYDYSTRQRVPVDYPPDIAPTARTEPVWEHPGEMPLDGGDYAYGTPWYQAVSRGLALGHLRIPDLMDMGMAPWAAESMTEYVGLTGIHAPIESLPSVLYHATTARSAVLREGLTSSEILRTEGKTPAGLAGSPSMISFTDAQVSAELVVRDYFRLVDLLQGRKKPMDLHDELLALPGRNDHLMQGFLFEVQRTERIIERGATGPGIRSVEAELADIFHEYLFTREQIGGDPNPIFVERGQALADQFKDVDRSQIGFVRVTARPGAQGFHRMDGSISEWRTWHGDAVQVEGGARTRYGLADAEAVARHKWDEYRESLKAQIRERRTVERQLKQQWAELKKEADELRIIRVDKRWFDKYKDGRFEVSLDDLRHLRDVQDTIRTEFPGYEVGPGPKLMTPWKAIDGPLQAMYVERSLLQNVLFDYGPLGNLTSMLTFLTEPVSASKMVIDSRRMYTNYLIPLGATPREIRRYFSILMEETKKHRWGPSDAPLYRGTTALPESVLRDTAHAVFSQKTIAAVEARYGGRWSAPMNMAYNSLIRRIETEVMAGGKPGMLARAIRGSYSRFHTTKGFGGFAEGTRMISKVVYPLVRFTIDVRWQAMNYLEADILALTYDGLRSTRAASINDIIVRHGRKNINVSEHAENLHGARNQLARVPGKTGAMPMEMAEAAGVFQTHKRMWPVFNRQFNLRREENIIKLIDSLPRTGPEYANLVKRLGDDPRTWSQQLEDMFYAYDQKGVAFSIRHEAERIRRGDGWTDEQWIQMQPFISRAIELNQRSFDDLVQMHIGNINRSRIERVLNSYWLYWPIGYQLKAGRWLLKVMSEQAFGAKSNMLGAYQINRWGEDFKDRLVQSPAFRREFEENEALWFAAAMFLPITPIDMGVSLNRGVRYVGGNVFGLWPEYEAIDSPFDVIQRMLSLGPLYTAQLLDSVIRSGYVQDALPDEPGSGQTEYR